MQHPMPRMPFLRRAAAAGLLLLSAACGGDAPEDQSATANAEAVDPASSATATDKETASFEAPADSLLTPRQVTAYLRTTLVQFDLITREAPQYHQKMAQMETRAEGGGLIAGLRNATDAAGMVAGLGDLVGGSFVRSARSQGLNPAEMEWVRERITEAGGHLALRPMQQQAVESARSMRQQAEQYRGQPGFDDAMVREMIDNANNMEREALANLNPSGALGRNIEVLHRALPNVTDHMWGAMALTGGAGGLLALTGLGNPSDTTTTRMMAEWRRIYTDALENRATPGMEASVPANQAHPRLDGQPAAN
ncbi:hypothetical protein [Longimicrobium sp.]|uniref:hypothetical protein n=1 Tax=Longimicrobium sp. TaxID=2029185 RepID=UPI002E354D3A|nr:hypothetical protein [Longimicrobium sp.]HEX6037604.1 hypothetical protein [Longimicrobium sp.]